MHSTPVTQPGFVLKKMFRELLSSIENALPLGLLGSVRYHGRRFRLRRVYFGALSYSLDYNNNLAAKDLDKIEETMRTLPFGPFFSSTDALLAAFVAMRFPGYGSFFANQRHGAPGETLELMSVEIPCRNKRRYFVVEAKPNGTLVIIADFIARDCAAVRARLNGDQVELLSRSGEVVLATTRI